MRRASTIAAACAITALTLTTAAPVAADTRDKLRHQRHHAAVLDQRANHQAAELRASRRMLARLDARANQALATLQKARFVSDRARAASDLAQQHLDAARQRTEAAREVLAETAAGAYRSLASGGQLAATLTLVQSGNPQTFLDGVQMLGEVGKQQSDAVDGLRIAEAEQLRSEHVAAAALEEAMATQQIADAAKKRADALVARQQQAVAREHRLLRATRARASHAHARARELARQIAAAEAKAAAIRRAQALAAASGPIPTCDGGSVSGYSNGQLPVSALCPLWGAPGEMLRADAAGAFNRMSKAYAQAFGTPLCVAASYRTYQRQVQLYATMPAGYAAVPGTSNHGWGLAVDLCGGIQVDNSPQHLWLLSHAAAFGWFHPSWARPGGPGPHEPWHWEYAG